MDFELLMGRGAPGARFWMVDFRFWMREDAKGVILDFGSVEEEEGNATFSV